MVTANKYLANPKPTEKAELSASHRRAPKQEKEAAHRYGGRLTAASGAKDIKGDVRIKRVARIECKTTKHKSFSVTLEMARKIEDAGIVSGEVPVLLIEFNENGRKLSELAVIPAYLLEEFCESKR